MRRVGQIRLGGFVGVACVCTLALAPTEVRGASPGGRVRFSRERQIELAINAAPPHISEHATIHVLEPKG